MIDGKVEIAAGRHIVERVARTRSAIIAVAALAAVLATAACGTAKPSAQPGSSSTASPGAHSGHTFVPPPAAALRTGEKFVTLTMQQSYRPIAPNGGTDEYRCFVVDPKLTSAAYLTGSQFLPQNVDIVHHAIFFRIGPDDAAKARAIDAQTPDAGWQCFGDSGVGGDNAWVAHWAPGANEVLLREGLGYPMPPGSLLVMQVHYNLLATGGQASQTDQSSIRLRLTDGTTAMTELGTFLAPAPVELPCTAQESGPLCDRATAVADVTRRFGDEMGETVADLAEQCDKGKTVPGPTQHCDHKVDGRGTIYAVAGHMHLLGRSIRIELNPGTPRAKTLLDIPVYNFDDQAIRPLDTPVALEAGDVVRVTCTHDAGLRKQLPQLQPLPPRYVVWGDGTSDEMCLGLMIGAQS
jgi:hypothetical protein